MTDRLDEIRARLAAVKDWSVGSAQLHNLHTAAPGDISFLLGEVERLTAAPRDVDLLALREQAHSEAVRGNEAEARVERLEALLIDLAENGLRADLNPTMDCLNTSTLYAGFSAYLRRLDAGLRERSAAALREACSFIPQTGDQA